MERKKWLLSVLMALLIISASTAHAQFRFGIKGGANISTVSLNKDILKSENVTGFHVGPLFEIMPDEGLGVDFAFLYSQKGFYANDESFVSDYLEVPVNLKMKIGLPIIAPFFAAGPYVNFLIGGDKERNIRDYIWNVDGQIKAKSFGAGLNFTAGVEVLKRLQVGLTYNWGLTDNYSTRESNINAFKGKPHTWMISATLMF